MFQSFTGTQYLKISIANAYGLDKKTWDERLAWFDLNQAAILRVPAMGEKEVASCQLLNDASEPAQMYAGCLAWLKATKGEPSGYTIALDATASGMQFLAIFAGDRRAAAISNVIDSGKRDDTYTAVFEAMQAKAGTSAAISRDKVKEAVMPALYGSEAKPREVFSGKLLDVFEKTMREVSPGAWGLMKWMCDLWDPAASKFEWVMPDGFDVQMHVRTKEKATVHLYDEPHEVEWTVKGPKDHGRAIGPNVVHSVDGMVVREMGRRCSYDPAKVLAIRSYAHVSMGKGGARSRDGQMVAYLDLLFRGSGFLSARILDHLAPDTIGLLCPEARSALLSLLDSLPERPFEVVAVHDCFRCLPGYGDDLRLTYNRILSELAGSDILAYLMTQVTGNQVEMPPADPAFVSEILEANYALS